MSGSDQGGAGRREVAYRVFAAEYEDADFSYSESDEERAPNYVVTPSGARINRLFVVGVLTEVEAVNDDVLRARIVDPTGAFVVYAGQYQPDEMAFLDRAEPPMFVSVTGKARTFQPDDSETVYTSVRPESINEVDAETRDRWTVRTAERTLDRIATMATALAREERGQALRDALTGSGVDEGLAAGTAMAIEHYGTTPAYLGALRETALDALRVVADEREEVRSLTVAPDASGDTTLSELTALDTASTGDPESTADGTTATASSESSSSTTGTDTVSTDSTGVDSTASDTQPTETSTATSQATTTETDTDPVSTEPTDTDESTESVTTDSVAETTDTEASEPDSTETETTVETAGTESAETDSIETTTDSVGTTSEDTTEEDDVGEFEPGEFELEDETREQIEDEYGTDFSTGTEVDEPGEADIETPDHEPAEESTESAAPDTDSEPTAEPEPESDPVSDSEPESATTEPAAEADDTDETPPADVDLDTAVMDVMRDLNGDDGADRAELIATVVDQYGVEPADVEDAIQEALMGGQCYEPDDSTLKPI